jgi:ABC-type cobalamin/Fe3+-siderophores transport system ATPase subunit
MKVITQKHKLPIKNVDFDDKQTTISKNGPLLPNSIRALICGPSGVGKTNLMFCLLTDPNGLSFENLYIYSKPLYQPKYMQMEKIMQSIPEINYHTFSNTSEVLSPDEASFNSVFIFDDVMCDKQQKMREFFSMGRHKSIDCFYLCQTYAKADKHLIRDNANLIVLFKQDGLNLKHVYDDHVNPEITFDEFKGICNVCWKKQYDFLTIDKSSDI